MQSPQNDMQSFADRILTCHESAEFEAGLFAGDAQKELAAMRAAAKGVAACVLREFGKILGNAPKILILAGSGHNGGDALGAGLEILKSLRSAKIFIYFLNRNTLKPNTKYFADMLLSKSENAAEIGEIEGEYDLVLEGLAGMGLRMPLRESLALAIEKANALKAKVKAAVDLPAGMGDYEAQTVFKSDICAMTGIAKAPLFRRENIGLAGRLRYVDLGFFSEEILPEKSIITERILEPLRRLRNVATDKRSYGHLFVFAGSKNYGGAALMNVKAALRSGAGLVSAFVPETLAPSFAAAEPAAIWIPSPTTEDGSLSLETFSLYRKRMGRETAILAGSGLSSNAETLALVSEILKHTKAAAVLDADAIRSDAVKNLKSGLITPHEGEFLRVARGVSDADLADFCNDKNVAVLLKGAVSRVSCGGKIAYNTSGSPILARAGSGDILAGIAGALLARQDLGFSPFEAGCAAAFAAGKVAESAYAGCGENAYCSSMAFDYFKNVF